MTTKTEAQRLADAPCHFEAPMNMRAHQDAAALLLKQEAAIKQLREALARIKDWDAAGLALTADHIAQADAALTATEGL